MGQAWGEPKNENIPCCESHNNLPKRTFPNRQVRQDFCHKQLSQNQPKLTPPSHCTHTLQKQHLPSLCRQDTHTTPNVPHTHSTPSQPTLHLTSLLTDSVFSNPIRTTLPPLPPSPQTKKTHPRAAAVSVARTCGPTHTHYRAPETRPLRARHGTLCQQCAE